MEFLCVSNCGSEVLLLALLIIVLKEFDWIPLCLQYKQSPAKIKHFEVLLVSNVSHGNQWDFKVHNLSELYSLCFVSNF